MDIRRYEPDDERAVVALLEATVGEGFARPTVVGARLGWIADDGGLCGVALAVVDEAGELRGSYAARPACADLDRLPTPGRIARIRQLAVRRDHRGRGLASALVARVEAAAAELGIRRVAANAWMPSDPAFPSSAGLFRRAGYEDLGEIADFYRDFSTAAGAHCPACGPPPCRCDVRVMLKQLAPADRRRG